MKKKIFGLCLMFLFFAAALGFAQGLDPFLVSGNYFLEGHSEVYYEVTPAGNQYIFFAYGLVRGNWLLLYVLRGPTSGNRINTKVVSVYQSNLNAAGDPTAVYEGQPVTFGIIDNNTFIDVKGFMWIRRRISI